MYWAIARDENGEKILDANGEETYELMDGQQRTISASLIDFNIQNNFVFFAKNIDARTKCNFIIKLIFTSRNIFLLKFFDFVTPH